MFRRRFWRRRHAHDHRQGEGDGSVGQFHFVPRTQIMSHVEAQFYRVLHDMFGRSYEIFPQIHLSALFDYPDGMHGSRNRQLDLINKWSVDYLICDSKSLQPIVAIELDDYTHDFPERRWRDREVERIFREGKIPLVRFADIQTLSSEDILSGLASHLPNHGPS